jgi:hypothetical protein
MTEYGPAWPRPQYQVPSRSGPAILSLAELRPRIRAPESLGWVRLNDAESGASPVRLPSHGWVSFCACGPRPQAPFRRENSTAGQGKASDRFALS